MAHEMFQLMQGHHEYNPAYANRLAMKAWVKEFKTDNGIALTDCITTDCFLLDFDKTFAKLFTGVRHDSGDPIAWGVDSYESQEPLCWTLPWFCWIRLLHFPSLSESSASPGHITEVLGGGVGESGSRIAEGWLGEF